MTTILVFLFGLVIGSFLNACIWRMANGKSVFRGRSMCPTCKKALHWYELIPLVSFLIQKGRCRGCKEKIDWQYPLVELATALLFVLVYIKLILIPDVVLSDLGASKLDIPYILSVLVSFYYVAVLIVLFVIDLRYGVLPDRITLPAIGVSLCFLVAETFFLHHAFPSWVAFGRIGLGALAAALGVAGFFALQFFMSKGKWVGGGDIRMGALMGVMLGWPLALVALALAYMIGGVFAGILLATRKKRFGQTVPMGPFLSAGTLLALFFGHQIIAWYWNMI